MGLTSGRRHRICQTTSAFYCVSPVLYGRALFSPVHCFEFLSIVLQILCLLLSETSDFACLYSNSDTPKYVCKNFVIYTITQPVFSSRC